MDQLGNPSRLPFGHTVVGPLDSELAFAAEQGGKAIWEKLKKLGEPTLDTRRKPVA